MAPPIRLAGVGTASSLGGEPARAEERARRLQGVLAALAKDGVPARLLDVTEELAVLAAHQALRQAGVPMPYGGEDLGLVLGVEEGIDGIKARYFRDLLRDGPLGASPLRFPLTTPNTIAARLSILFDLRGEALTLAGGSLSGAHAMGQALSALRRGDAGRVLAGAAMAAEQEFLDALILAGRSETGPGGAAACLFLLEALQEDGGAADGGAVLGYGQAFGGHSAREAIQACLEDAGLRPEAVGSVRTAAVCDWRAALAAVRETGVTAAVSRSPAAGRFSAAFPLAVEEVVRGAGHPAPVLVLGEDCLAGAAAALVRGEA